MSTDLWNPNRDDLLVKYDTVLNNARRIYSWTTGAELAWLAEYAANKKHLLEIGSYVGKSAYVMLNSNPDLRITSFDTWDDEGTEEEIAFNLRNVKGRWIGIQGNSAHTLNEKSLRRKGTESVAPDSAFIDGGHLYDDVVADIRNVQNLLPSGTVVCGHDYRADLPEDGVTKAVREFLPRHKNVIDSIWVAILP